MFLGALLIATGFPQTRSVVKPGDNVNVVCEEEPSLSKDYTITRDGYIVMQFVGAVNIAGLDEPTAGAKISATLIEQRILPKATVRLKVLGTKTALIAYGGAVSRTGDIFPRPGLRLSDIVAAAQPTPAADLERVRITTADGKDLIVNFKAFDGKDMSHNPELRAGDRVFFDLITRPLDVMVTGQVARPGAVPYKDGMTLRSAIAMAGGLSAIGDPKTVRLEHAGQVRDIDLGQEDAPLQAGDRIFVPEQKVLTYVNVEGAVVTPRRVPFREGLTLSQAVEAAGGTVPKADLSKVQIVRAVDGKNQTNALDLSSIYAGKSGDMPLRPNDRVNVPMMGARRSRGMSQTLKVVGAIVVGAMFGILKF